MSDLIDKLPEMLLEGAKLDAEEGEYGIEEHINYMAAHRIRGLEGSLFWLKKLERRKSEQVETLESQLKELERAVEIVTDRLIQTQNETAYGKQKARIAKLEAENETYRQEFVRLGCENARLRAVYKAANEVCNFTDGGNQVIVDLEKALVAVKRKDDEHNI